MARSLPGPCNYPGCPNITFEPYCEDHSHVRAEKQKRYDSKRPGSSARGYGSKWRKLRDMHLRREPFCRMCRAEGRRTPATMVDHIKPLSQGGDNNWENLQALCHSCHMKKTAAETKTKRRG